MNEKTVLSELVEQLTPKNKEFLEIYTSALRENTRKTNESELINFMAYISKDVTETSLDELKSYIDEQKKERGISDTTANKKIGIIQSFMNNIEKRGLIKVNPLADASALKKTPKKIRTSKAVILTPEQLNFAASASEDVAEVIEHIVNKGLGVSDTAEAMDVESNHVQYLIRKKIPKILEIDELKYSDLAASRFKNKKRDKCPCGEEVHAKGLCRVHYYQSR